MTSQVLKKRTVTITDDVTVVDTAAHGSITMSPKQRLSPKKTAKAKRALNSLALALVIPISLTSLSTFFFGSSPKYQSLHKPMWFPPVWFIHTASMGSSLLMGLAAWLVWADGGFGFQAQTDALPLYVAHVSLNMTWDPLVFRIGALPVGLLFSSINLVTLLACLRDFRVVNPLAGDLVRPCLAWLAFLTFVNYKLIYLQ